MIDYQSYTQMQTYRDSWLQSLESRWPLDHYLHKFVKGILLMGSQEEIDAFIMAFGGDLSVETEQAAYVRNHERLYRKGVTVLPDGYEPSRLSADALRTMPLERRVFIARSLLAILDDLENHGIFPGPIDLNAVIYDGSGSYEAIYLGSVPKFQIGILHHSFSDHIGDTLSKFITTCVDRRIQHISDARIVLCILAASEDECRAEDLDNADSACQDVIRILRGQDILPPYRINSLIADKVLLPSRVDTPQSDSRPEAETPPPVSKQRPKRKFIGGDVGLCIVTPPCSAAHETELCLKQITFVQSAAALAFRNKKGVKTAYVWANTPDDTLAGSGKCGHTAFLSFDTPYLPPITEDTKRDMSYFKHAFIAGDIISRRSRLKKVLMVVLLPDVKSYDANWVCEQAREMRESTGNEVIFLRSGEEWNVGLNIDNDGEREKLPDMIRDAFMV